MPRKPGKASFARKLGTRIRALRTEAEITQEALAWESDLDKGFLSQIEAGKRIPSLPVLLMIAKTLGVEPADLLVLEVTKPRLRLLEAARRQDRAAAHEALRKLGLS
jgi:transcriptional regulator with XRE-family HTH domain